MKFFIIWVLFVIGVWAFMMFRGSSQIAKRNKWGHACVGKKVIIDRDTLEITGYYYNLFSDSHFSLSNGSNVGVEYIQQKQKDGKVW